MGLFTSVWSSLFIVEEVCSYIRIRSLDGKLKWLSEEQACGVLHHSVTSWSNFQAEIIREGMYLTCTTY